jgi:hypothetical protein
MPAPTTLHRSVCPRAGRLGSGLARWGIGAVLGGLLSIACNDPYSQRRIERRWNHFDETANSIINREVDGTRRLKEADETLKKWWEHDTERFNRRIPTIGDYFW